MITSDATFEHVADAAFAGAEFARTLKSSGSACARTPNRWGYVAIGSGRLPDPMHQPLLKILQPHRKDNDIFLADYSLNTPRSIRGHLPSGLGSNHSSTANAEPVDFGEAAMVWRMLMLDFRFLPDRSAPPS